MRIMVVARAIDRIAGGVEHMASLLMNEMTARGHKVELMSWDLAGASSFFALAPGIIWHKLDRGDPHNKAGLRLMGGRAGAIRRIMRASRPDVIIAFQHGPFISTRFYCAGLDLPIIAAEREAPTRFEHLKAGKWRRMIFHSFRLAQKVTVQLESYRSIYPSYLHDRIIAIPNPVPPALNRADPDRAINGRFQLLSIGRLAYQKNFGALIDAFASVAASAPDWDLVIVGEGEERNRLDELIRQRRLTDRISLPGNSRDVAAYYRSSHAFCLPARWEGFPNALAEALAHGLPSIGFAGCSGVNELIRHGENGLLAGGNGDTRTLAEAIAGVTANAAIRRRMGDAAPESVTCYAPSGIFDRWERLLREAVS